jgi:hypothetical protein
LQSLHEEFASLAPTDRNMQVTCIVLSIHMASQSNLFAAIAWTIVNVVSNENARTKVAEEIRQTREQFGENWLSNQKVQIVLFFSAFVVEFLCFAGDEWVYFLGTMLSRVNSHRTAKSDAPSGDEAHSNSGIHGRARILHCHPSLLFGKFFLAFWSCVC